MYSGISSKLYCAGVGSGSAGAGSCSAILAALNSDSNFSISSSANCGVVDGVKVLNKISFTVLKGDKIAIVSNNDLAKTTLFNILAGVEKFDKGQVLFGKTISPACLPQDNSSYFIKDESILDWIKQYKKVDDDTELRGFLGRMLFSKEDVFKKVNILSGGEKARCMLSKMMLEEPNFLILDEPTNHLDLESITSLNKGLENFEGELILTSRDHELNQTVCNRIIEIKEDGSIIDRRLTFDEYFNQ